MMQLAVRVEVAMVIRMFRTPEKMNRSLLKILFLACLLPVLSACSESARPTASGKGEVQGINAVIASPPLTFRIEERQTGILAFKSHSKLSWDDLPYTFSFDLLFPGDLDATRVASTPLEVAVDVSHTLALTGSLSSPTVVQWQQPLRKWDSSEPTIGVAFGNLTQTFGAIDVYFAAEGIPPAAGQARASFSFGEFVPEVEMPAGFYVITITPQGDPTTILHQTSTFILLPATSYLVGVFDPDASHTSPFGLRLLWGANNESELPDVNSPPATRLVNASFDSGPVDTYLNSDFSAPLFANTAYAGVTERKDFAAGTSTVTFTAAGNQGAPVHETTVNTLSSSVTSLILFGSAGDYRASNVIENSRGIELYGRVRGILTSLNVSPVDVYIFPKTEDINNLIPTFVLFLPGSVSEYRGLIAGTYEVAVTATGSKTVLSQISDVPLAKGDVVEFIIMDTADPNSVEILQLP
jgi:hypothetical protein